MKRDTTFSFLLVLVFVGLLAMLFTASFKEQSRRREIDKKVPRVTSSDNGSYRLRLINSCEYIESLNTYGSSLTHKGDCTNSIHLYNK